MLKSVKVFETAVFYVVCYSTDNLDFCLALFIYQSVFLLGGERGKQSPAQLVSRGTQENGTVYLECKKCHQYVYLWLPFFTLYFVARHTLAVIYRAEN